eukprot:5934490-Amphidinium_carterae.1
MLESGTLKGVHRGGSSSCVIWEIPVADRDLGGTLLVVEDLASETTNGSVARAELGHGMV